MQRDPRAFLWDVQAAAQAILTFTRGMDAAAYSANEMAQAAVERKFEIIGEALNQLARLDGSVAARIPDVPQGNRGSRPFFRRFLDPDHFARPPPPPQSP